jgi:hypothetical protein
MFRCEKCGAEVIYLESAGVVIKCDPEMIEIVTERGNRFRGYCKHLCAGGEDGCRCRNDKKVDAKMLS